MNAVERLLAHGERVLTLYDEMYRERLGSGRDPDLPDVPQGLMFSVGGRAIDEFSKHAQKRRVWASGHWLQAAVETAWLEARKPGRRGAMEWLPRNGSGSDAAEAMAARAAAIFLGHLGEREQMLCRESRQRLLADVVEESRKWDPFPEKVVGLAEDVVEQIRRVGRLSDNIEPLDWQRRGRTRLRDALDLLHPYHRPPATAATPEKQTGCSSSRRPPAGGRPRKKSYDSLRQAIIADRNKEKRKKNPEPLKTWLTRWATEHDMKRADALKMYNAEMAAIRRAQQARSR